MKKILEYAGDNPGAMSFIIELLDPTNGAAGIIVFSKIDKIHSLRGTNLYVMWSDLCNREMDKVVKLCRKCPDEILADACNRQDYSGRELVAEYLK
jgi:hypothetical protein